MNSKVMFGIGPSSLYKRGYKKTAVVLLVAGSVNMCVYAHVLAHKLSDRYLNR